MTRYGQSTLNSSPDTSYGSDPAEPDISPDELKQLCQEYLARLQVGGIKHIILLLITTHRCPMRRYIRTVDQGDDQSGEWIVQCRGRATASSFGEITKLCSTSN